MHPLLLLPVALAAFGVGLWLGKRKHSRSGPVEACDVPLPWEDLEANRLESAFARLAALPATRWTSEAWECKVSTLRRMGAAELAWQAVEAGLQAAPSFGLWLERHALAIERGDLPLADQALQAAGTCLEAAEAPPEDRAEWLLRMAEFAFLDRGNAALALEALDRMGSQSMGHETMRLRIQILMALGRFGEAQEMLAPLLHQAPSDAELRLFEAECQGGQGAWDRVRDLLRTLPPELQQRAEYWHLQGLAAAHLGEKPKARDHFERALDLAPTHPGYALDAAHAWMDLGDFTQAERQARCALHLDPASEGAFLLLAECRQGLQDPEGARRLLRECLLRHPESTEAQHFLAELEAQ